MRELRLSEDHGFVQEGTDIQVELEMVSGYRYHAMHWLSSYLMILSLLYCFLQPINVLKPPAFLFFLLWYSHIQDYISFRFTT